MYKACSEMSLFCSKGFVPELRDSSDFVAAVDSGKIIIWASKPQLKNS